QTGRYPRWQNHAQVRNRAGAGRTVAARHFRRKGRGREGHVLNRALRHLRNRDGCEGFLAPGSLARETDADGDEASAQDDYGRLSQEERGIDGTVDRLALEHL